MRFLIKHLYELLRVCCLKVENRLDHHLLDPSVPVSDSVNHEQWLNTLVSEHNVAGKRVLEVGSREVTGVSRARQAFDKAEYVGFDIYEGPNVDVVGDAHRLSTYFSEEDKFDLVFSSACFEHFALPWVVAVEIAKVLSVGGSVFVETHFSFSSHERPWNFFQFSDMGLRALFSPALGFECLDAAMSNPIAGRFSIHSAPYLRNRKVGGLYCHSEYYGRKVREVENINWGNVDLKQVVGDTCYPEPDAQHGALL